MCLNDYSWQSIASSGSRRRSSSPWLALSSGDTLGLLADWYPRDDSNLTARPPLGSFGKDDRYSFWECYTDMDQGGGHANAPALPPANANGHQAALDRMTRRHGLAFTALLDHVAEDGLVLAKTPEPSK